MSLLLAEPDWQPLLSICLNQSNLKPYPKSNTIFKKVVLYIELDVYSILSMFMTLLWFRQVLGVRVYFSQVKIFSQFFQVSPNNSCRKRAEHPPQEVDRSILLFVRIQWQVSVVPQEVQKNRKRLKRDSVRHFHLTTLTCSYQSCNFILSSNLIHVGIFFL